MRGDHPLYLLAVAVLWIAMACAVSAVLILGAQHIAHAISGAL